MKIRCINDRGQNHTKAKVYNVEKNIIQSDNGDFIICGFDGTVESINRDMISQFELVDNLSLGFTLDDIEVGMVVEFRNGEVAMIMPCQNGYIFDYGEGAKRLLFNDFNDDLTFNTIKYSNHLKYDIMKIYGFVPTEHSTNIVSIVNRPLIWTREKIKITKSEIAEKFKLKIDDFELEV